MFEIFLILGLIVLLVVFYELGFFRVLIDTTKEKYSKYNKSKYDNNPGFKDGE